MNRPCTEIKYLIISYLLFTCQCRCESEEDNNPEESNSGFEVDSDPEGESSIAPAEAKCVNLDDGRCDAGLKAWTDRKTDGSNGLPLRRRVEIHPRSEGRVTLNQIERECEESMRKQLKENQHKKKLQFNFIGKRTDTKPCRNIQSDKNCWKTSNNQCPDICHTKDRPMSSVKDEVDKMKSLTDDYVNYDRTGEAASKIDHTPKLNSTADGIPDLNMNRNNVKCEDDKTVLKQINNYQDQDLKLLRILYEGLNSKDGGINEVEPLVQTLKDIAEKKIAINMITHKNTNKPVGRKISDTEKTLKHSKELFSKIKKFKEKRTDTRLPSDQFGSSPLDPNLFLNNDENNLDYPSVSEALLSIQPKEAEKTKKNILSDSYDCHLNPVGNVTDDKSLRDYSIFVNLVDRILGSANENNAHTSELLHNLNKKVLGTSKELVSDQMLKDLLKEFNYNIAKVKGVAAVRGMNRVRNERDAKSTSGRGASKQVISRVKNDRSDAPYDHAHGKNWAKSDELKRLQKVATELKSKIDDLLCNLDATSTDQEEEEEDEDEEEEEEEEDEGDEESSACGESSTQVAKDIANSVRCGKTSNYDPFDSFKKFKFPESKTDRKMMDCCSQDVRTKFYKAVAKKLNSDTTANNKTVPNKMDNFNKSHKTRRSKRSANIHHDKYDIYHFEPCKCRNGNLDEVQDTKNYLYNPLLENQLLYSQPFKNCENNFNVFKVTNEFKKKNRNFIETRKENVIPLDKFNKYLFNNHLSANLCDIQKQYEKLKTAHHVNDDQPLRADGMADCKRYGTKLDFSSLDDAKDPPSAIFQNFNMNNDLNSKIPCSDQLYDTGRSPAENDGHYKRSLANLLDYFKSDKGKLNKMDSKTVNKITDKDNVPDADSVKDKNLDSCDSKETIDITEKADKEIVTE